MDTALFDLFVDSFWQILLPGLTVTIPLTAIAFSGALVIAVVVALIQYAHVPVLKDLARFYIWVTRGTPLLVQLFVVFYGLCLQRGCLLRRNHPCGTRICSCRAA